MTQILGKDKKRKASKSFFFEKKEAKNFFNFVRGRCTAIGLIQQKFFAAVAGDFVCSKK